MCVYIAALGEMAVIGVYVDDFVVACMSDERLKQIKKDLCRRFAVKDLGELHHFLGIRVARNDEGGDIWVGQPLCTERVLGKLGMQNKGPVGTSLDVSRKLTKAVDGEALFDWSECQSVVSCLLYLSASAIPDIH